MRLFIHPCTDTIMHLLLFTSLKSSASHPTKCLNMRCDSEKQKKTPLTFIPPIANETLSAIWFCFAYISYIVRVMHTISWCGCCCFQERWYILCATYIQGDKNVHDVRNAHDEVILWINSQAKLIYFSLFWRTSLNNCGLLQ